MSIFMVFLPFFMRCEAGALCYTDKKKRQEDAGMLRDLALSYAELAAQPRQEERQQMWRRLNGLHMDRPMVLIDQIPWNEMDVDGSLQCSIQHPYWRDVEWNLRTTLYKARYFPVDLVLNPYISLLRPVEDSGWGIVKQMSGHIVKRPGDTASSYEYINQIQSMEDLEKIHAPRITLDREKEAEIIAQAHEIFDGIIDFKMLGKKMKLGLWDAISTWMGVENCYFAMMDEPELIHALMEKLTQGLIEQIRQMNELEVFDITSNLCHCSQTFREDLPLEGDRALSGNAWGYGLAQLFTAVSPQLEEEFEMQYMKRIFPYFGAVYYGCCERLDDRMAMVRKLPKVRKISCSPWSNRERFAEEMPPWCVMSNKPNPAFLASGSLDEEIVRQDIRRTMDAAKKYGRSVELILKDISTVRNRPDCLVRWAQIAMEEVENW